MRFARITYGVILTGAAAWCVLILAAPALLAIPPLAPFGAMLYAFFSPLCHQIDSRSFHLFGAPLAVCGRCASVYFAFLLGAIAYPLARGFRRARAPGLLFILAAAAPMVIEYILEEAGLFESSNVIRAVTGAWFGILLPLLVVPGAVEGVSQLFTQHNPTSVPPQKGLVDA